MPIASRAVLAAVVALAVGFGLRHFSEGQWSGWTVPPDQVAAANPKGRAGIGASPGAITVLPVRRETAGLDRLLWAGTGLGAGLLVFAATRKRGPG